MPSYPYIRGGRRGRASPPASADLLERQRHPIGRHPCASRRIRRDHLARIMRLERPPFSPFLNNDVRALPERQFHVLRSGKMLEETHPERRDSLVVKILETVMSR